VHYIHFKNAPSQHSAFTSENSVKRNEQELWFRHRSDPIWVVLQDETIIWFQVRPWPVPYQRVTRYHVYRPLPNNGCSSRVRPSSCQHISQYWNWSSFNWVCGGVDLTGLGQGPMAGSRQHGSEPVDPTGDWQFDDALNNYRLLVKKSLYGGDAAQATESWESVLEVPTACLALSVLISSEHIVVGCG
jgi:hypothetical protein